MPPDYTLQPTGATGTRVDTSIRQLKIKITSPVPESPLQLDTGVRRPRSSPLRHHRMDEELPEDGYVVGGHVARLSVALRVMGDEVDPSEITRLFGLTPKFAARRGEQVQRGSRTVTQRSGIWTYGLAEEPSPEWELEDAIVALLSRFPDDPALWKDLGTRFRLDVFCGLFMSTDNQGTVLSPQTLGMLAVRGLTLDLDIYGPPPGDGAT